MENESHPILARTLDLVMLPMLAMRRGVVEQARGEVLEIGIGTGANLPYYRPTQIASLVGLEPDPAMRMRAQGRAERLGIRVEWVDGDAAALPFANASFDTVVCTFVLCTIPDAVGAAHEMARVLRPGGELLFAEHTHAEGACMHALHRGVTPLWKRVMGGCHLDRDGVSMLREAGLQTALTSPSRWKHSPFPVHFGVARHA